jgi:tetratricopeptide (TPR) repeat protein
LALAHNGRGNAYYDKNDNDRALADFNKAIELDPKFAFAYNNRGIAYRAKGDNERTIEQQTRGACTPLGSS